MAIATFSLMALLAIYLLGMFGSCFLLYKLTGGDLKTKIYLLAPTWPVLFVLTLIGCLVFWAIDPEPVVHE